MNTNLKHEVVAILGAHPSPSRYAYLAADSLLSKGHTVIPVGRRPGETAGGLTIETDPSVLIGQNVDTVTLYINPTIQEDYKELISKIHPKRVIFNPGTENMEWAKELESEGIEADMACTLVLLSTGQY